MQQSYKIAKLNQILCKIDTKLSSNFCIRLGANFPLIYDLFHQIYGESQQKYLDKIINVLIQKHSKRPIHLISNDEKLNIDPAFILNQNWVGYSVYVDRFCRNLENLKDKLSYFKELGINLIHLMPILETSKSENDGGYAVQNYKNVAEQFGSLKQLEDVISEFQKHDIYIVLDVVLNHCADSHEWAKAAKNGNTTYQDYFYMYDNKNVPDIFEKSLPEIFPNTAPGNFTYISEIDKWVMTVFNQYQWDLNYRNPQIIIEILEIILYWSNKGVNIFRLDAVAFIWKKLGTQSQNLPQVHDLLQIIKLCCKIVAPTNQFIAEAIVAPKEILKYFGENHSQGDECDIAYNAHTMALYWDALASRDTRLLTNSLRKLPHKPSNTTWINYVRCHDDIGLGFDDQGVIDLHKNPKSHRSFLIDFYCNGKYDTWSMGAMFMYNPKTGDARISGTMASLCGIEQAFEQSSPSKIQMAIDRILLLHSITLSYGGLPMIFYGDELATINDYSYLQDDEKKLDNRWMHRPIITEEKISKRLQIGSPEHTLFSRLQHLIAVRKQEPLFADHNNLNYEESFDSRIFAILRWNLYNERILILCNFSEVEITIPQALYQKILWKKSDCKDISHSNNTDIDVLQAYGFKWLKEF